MQPGSKNVFRVPLVEREKLIMPSLRIKLGHMKNFVKALENNSNAFRYLSNKFPEFSYSKKMKDGVFISPQIRKIIVDSHFEGLLSSTKKDAWLVFKSVVTNFLGNYKPLEYINIVQKCIRAYSLIGCHVSLKIHLLDSFRFRSREPRFCQ